MKYPERKRIARALGNLHPPLRLYGRSLAVTPIERILRGFYIEDSSDPNRVYLWAFVQPLFVLSDSVVLGLGRRLGGGACKWSLADVEGAASALVEEGIQFFGPISSPSEITRWKVMEDRSDEYAREVKAYSLIAAGRYHEGSQALRALVASLRVDGPMWMADLKQRAEDLLRRAETDGESAQQRLREWEFESRAALGLDVRDAPQNRK